MKRVLVAASVALLILAPVAVVAAGPGDAPSSTPETGSRNVSRQGFGGMSETTITGLAVDKAGKPLNDVSVKLYMGGLLADEQLTSADGSFEFIELIDYGTDQTIDLWFVPPNDDLVMENVLLKESSSAKQYGLYSPCVQRQRLDPITDVIVKLYPLEDRIDMLKRKGCIE
jgi:hypothetical protein